MVDEADITCTSDMYIEANSKLAAMETFLNELRGDSGARALLLSMVEELKTIVSTGLEVTQLGPVDSESVHRSLGQLRRAVVELPVDEVADQTAWQQVRRCHRRCQKSFSQFVGALFDHGRHQRASVHPGRYRQIEATA